MYNVRQTAEIVDKLIELTQHRILVWSKDTPPYYMNNNDSRVSIVYTSFYANAYLRIYECNYKYYLDEEKFVWDMRIVLEFTDQDGISLGELPVVPNSRELLKAIQYQDPNINNFYNNLFSQ